MSASNAFETALLGLIFNNNNIANVGDATGLRGATVPGNLYIALHTANPDEGGSQNTSEATYTGYARVAVARTSSGFTVTGATVANAGVVSFPGATGGSNTITHFSIGVASTGAGTVLQYGALDQSLAISSGITPSFAIGDLTVSVD